MGRHAEAIAEMMKALELDPLSLPMNNYMGNTYLYAGEYGKALEQFQHTIDLDPNFPLAHFFFAEFPGGEQRAATLATLARRCARRRGEVSPLVCRGVVYAVALHGARSKNVPIREQRKGCVRKDEISGGGGPGAGRGVV
jgi:tetratricopeptide (TPR) repeat protein